MNTASKYTSAKHVVWNEALGIRYSHRALHDPVCLCRAVIGATFQVPSDYLKSSLMVKAMNMMMLKVVTDEEARQIRRHNFKINRV